MKNKEIAAIFDEIADMLEIRGESVFRVNAYRNASRALEELTRDVGELAAEDSLKEVKGFGKSMVEHVKEYLGTGKVPRREELAAEVPADLVKMMRIPGLGPKTIKLMHEKLGVETLEDLRRMMDSGQLAELPGMGEKKVENIRRGYQLFAAARERMTLGVALPAAESIVEALAKMKDVKEVTCAGSLRRMRETIGDIDILAAGDGPKIVEAFTKLTQVKEILGAGDTKASVRLTDDLQIDLRVVEPASWGAALQYFTGSKAHNIRLREQAISKKMKVNEYGLFKGEKRIAGKTEAEIYEALGLDLIPPEMREDRGEIELAAQHKLPKLVTVDDIRGDLQMHSTHSDGRASIARMAEAAKAMGYEYILMTDHSQSLRVAGGVTIDEIDEVLEEVAEVNRKMKGFRVFAGTEVDIMPDGSLDYPDKVLAKFDIVLASVHTRLDDPSEKMTLRLIRAIENPHVKIIGHPTGRRFGYREASSVDMDKVMRAAAKHGAALEINAHYERLDLNDVQARMAVEHGVMITLGTDSHSAEMLANMRFGVAVARRAWLEPKHVLNTRAADEVLKWCRKGR